MKRYRFPFIALAAGLLLWAAWPVSPLTLIIFIAWIPLLWLEAATESRKQFFILTYITMLIWNVSTTWWIWNASAPGALGAFLANSLLMCFPWLGFKIVKKRLGDYWGYASLISFWMAFEYLHLHDWGLSWPWLTLGNAFATHPEWVQWYEYTGTSGGTCWILIVNIFLFLHIKNNSEGKKRRFTFLVPGIILLIIPVLISVLLGRHAPITITNDSNIVVVQPNIDPYEKVSDESGLEKQLAILIRESETQVDEQTRLLVWPETALFSPTGLNEADLKNNISLAPLWEFLNKYPGLSLFTGIESFRRMNQKTPYSQEFNGEHFESYNGSVVLDSAGAHAFYHKSMLVPGVETLPWFLKFIDKWFEKFGGTTAGYARQEERTVLPVKSGYKIAPSICYESIYGEFMSAYVRNGANLICIITNDGWWENTPGHKQHVNYARLRAIETRTWVARSANTGISCFIDPYGKLINPQPYNTIAAIKYAVPVSQQRTFFVKYGDLLSKLMVISSIGIFLWVIILKIKHRSHKK